MLHVVARSQINGPMDNRVANGFHSIPVHRARVITRRALSPISVIKDIGLSLIRNLRYRNAEGTVRHYVGYGIELFADIRYPTFKSVNRGFLATERACNHIHA
jgi:hypothetical protein